MPQIEKLIAAAEKTKKRIERENTSFKKLNVAGKRVVIAKDVLEALRLKRIKAQRGTYFMTTSSWGDLLKGTRSLHSKGPYGEEVVKGSTEVKAAFDAIPTCSACALGSVFMATVQRCDALSVKAAVHYSLASYRSPTFFNDRMTAYLSDYFTVDQLLLIEDAFEGKKIQDHWSTPTTPEQKALSKLRTAATRFNSPSKAGKKLTPRERLERIMRNIIRNRGTFKP